MALNYKTLEYKPVINRNGDTFLDLLVQTIKPNAEIEGSIIAVNKYYVARPDLISMAMYGDDQYADIICKVNGISNPFEINENDILVIPDIESIMMMTISNPEKSVFIDGKNGKKDFIDNTVNTSLQKDVKALRSPNEQVKGMQNFIVDDEHGIVIY